MEAYRNDIFPGIGHVIHLADKLVDRELCRHSAALDTRFMEEGGLYSDHHPFPRNGQTGNMELGMTFMELWFSDAPALDANNISSICHNRLRSFEVLEVTGHPPGQEYNLPECPLTLDNDHLQLLAAFQDADGQWNVHLLNHGPDCTLTVGGGKVTLPARGLVQCRFSP